MALENIRNFVIIAHIDHGKSTLADRLLEITGTVPARRMRPQYLDQLELERERGITIKMAPVRMHYGVDGESYVLNLIDTPGHSDFSYEVSRALAAVEGAILLVDAAKGIQAQTLSNFRAAKRAGLAIIGAVNKIDLKPPHVRKTAQSLAELLEVSESAILKVSGKTGEGVRELLDAVIRTVPPPSAARDRGTTALIFDSLYDEHKGILAYVRLFGGEIRTDREVFLSATRVKVKAKEIGGFFPQRKPTSLLSAGEIGYLATGLKEPGLVKIGDTVLEERTRGDALPGYREPIPVVFISFYPDGDTEFDDLKNSFAKLKLNDAALSFEPESNDALGRGLKVGFLGQLHFEIAASRLKNEFGLEFLTSFPSVAYRVRDKGKEYVIKQAGDLPDKPEKVFQPIITIEILVPAHYVNQIIGLKNAYSIAVSDMKNVGENVLLTGTMPLSELLRDFDDQLKSSTSGYASFSYEVVGEEEAHVEKLEIMVAGETIQALTRVVAARDVEREARASVEKLKELLPKQQFAQAIQARAQGRIIARETVPALRKDVTGYLYGGDRTRKMKLWKKQKRGKEKLKGLGRVSVPLEVFREILKK